MIGIIVSIVPEGMVDLVSSVMICTCCHNSLHHSASYNLKWYFISNIFVKMKFCCLQWCGVWCGARARSVYTMKRDILPWLFINFYGPRVRTRGIPQYTDWTPPLVWHWRGKITWINQRNFYNSHGRTSHDGCWHLSNYIIKTRPLTGPRPIWRLK